MGVSPRTVATVEVNVSSLGVMAKVLVLMAQVQVQDVPVLCDVR